MNRGQSRAFLRSKLGDRHPTNPTFSDSTLNLTLLTAARLLQNRVNVVDPNPYTKTAYADLVNGVDTYSLPGDYRSPGERIVKRLIDGEYQRVTRIQFTSMDKLLGSTEQSESNTGYSIGGKLIQIFPTPTADLVNGLKITYAAQVTYADDSDSSVPQLPLEILNCVHLVAFTLICSDIGLNGDDETRLVDKIIKEWAEGFKSSHGVDGNQIESLGGHNRIGWKK